MTAEPWLILAARSLAKQRLETVLIGNAAAALQGSPVTTMDLDPASGLFRVVRDRDGLQFDFMARVDGIRSFESLRSRATSIRFGRHALLVAALEDIIRSKQAADRPQDRAVLPVLRRTLREKTKGKG